MDYEWDVFVSYEHDAAMGSWVPDHLIPFLKSFVGNALNRPAKIFFDRTGILTGQSWPMALRNALGRARCLVAVWTPLYFHSDWCRRECAVMLHRERLMDYRTQARPDGLVIPINVFDGHYFPRTAQEIHWFDFSEYWIAGPAFRTSVLYVEFQNRLKKLATEVAVAINRAPDWDELFIDTELLDVDTQELMPPSTTNFAFPGTE